MSKSRGHRLSKAIDDWYEALRNELGSQPEPSPDSPVYPIASEQLFSALAFHSEEVEASILEEMRSFYEDDDVRYNFALAHYRSLTRPDLTQVLATSLLSTAIYGFENYLGALARTALNVAGSESLGDLPDVPFDIVRSYGQNVATNDLERWAIDRRVEDFVRGGYPEWRDTFSRWAKFNIEQTGGNWSTIREAIARNKAYGRGTGGRIDAEYLASLDSEQAAGLTLWGELVTSASYFRSLSDELEVTACCLGLRWTRQFLPNGAADVTFYADRAVRLEQRELWGHALAVFSTLLDTFVHSDHSDFNVTKINEWLCRRQLGTEDEAMRQAIDRFQITDSYYRLGLMVLKRDWDGFAIAVAEYEVEARNDKSLRDLHDMLNQPIVKRALKERPDLKSLFTSSGPQGVNGRRGKRRSK
ncbi:hypothetical protein AB0J85_00320 [Micromonospora echinofusca]|uniref:hypothetical protein n=1 Tax=Micromonospora echinofusca TaxID=47858 RepID=UPI00341B584D